VTGSQQTCCRSDVCVFFSTFLLYPSFLLNAGGEETTKKVSWEADKLDREGRAHLSEAL
jgi:hypothetical protein